MSDNSLVNPVPLDALGAVNLVLRSVRESPISTLEPEDGNPSVEIAITTLGDVATEVQSQGWNFNTEAEMELSPSTDGTIALPANLVTVDTSGCSRSLDLVERGGKLYDRDKHTYNIGTKVTLDMTLLLPFEELPQQARWYIAVKAARHFASEETTSVNVYRFTMRDEEKALARLEQLDAGMARKNLANVNPFIAKMRGR